MSEIIRTGGIVRCASLAFVVLFGLLAACPGQEQAAPAPAQDTKQDPPKDATAPAAPATVTPPPAAAPAPAQDPTLPTAQPDAKGKGAPKKGKGSKPVSAGQVTSNGVQEKPYVIGPEDVLYLNVLHQPDVSGLLEVRPDGYVSVRFAGELKAAGLTPPQLADAIAEKLKTYFNNPEVNIQVTKINSKKYYISGEVHKAGAFPLTAPITIYEALIQAGGLAEFAKGNKIYVLRGKERLPFNYKEVSKGNHLELNVLLENGDVIVVP